MKAWLRITTIATVSLLNACSLINGLGTDNTSDPTPLKKYAPTINVKSSWNSSVGSGSQGDYLKLLVVQANNALFTADSKGRVTATNAANGKQIWQTDTDTTITAGPAVGNDLVIVGTKDARVIALNAASGKVVWRSVVANEVLAPPTIAGNHVLVKTLDGSLTVLNIQDGSNVWVYDHTAPLMVLRASAMPKAVVDNGLAVVGFSDGHLTGLNIAGQRIVWDQVVAAPKGTSEVEQLVDVAADPVIADGVVYVATYQGNLAAVRVSDAKILWQRDLSAYAGIALTSRLVIVSDADSNLWAFERSNGQLVWSNVNLKYRKLSAPALLNDRLIVGDGEGYLHVLDINDGHFLAQVEVKSGEAIIAPAVVDASNNKIYVVTSEGTLAAFKVSGMSS